MPNQKSFIKWLKDIIFEIEPIIQANKFEDIIKIQFVIDDGYIYQKRPDEPKRSNLKDWLKNPLYNGLRSQHGVVRKIYNQNKHIFTKYGNISFECSIVPPIYGNILTFNRPYGILIPEIPITELSQKEFHEMWNEISNLDQIEIQLTQYRIDDRTLEIQSYESIEIWEIQKIGEKFDVKELSREQQNVIMSSLDKLESYLDSKPYASFNFTQFDQILKDPDSVQKPLRDRLIDFKNEVYQNSKDILMDIRGLVTQYLNQKIKNGEDGITFRSRKELLNMLDEKYFEDLNSKYWEFKKRLKEGQIDKAMQEWAYRIVNNQNKKLGELVDEEYEKELLQTIRSYDGKNIQEKTINYIIQEKWDLIEKQDTILKEQINICVNAYDKLYDLMEDINEKHRKGLMWIKIRRQDGSSEMREFSSMMYVSMIKQIQLLQHDMKSFIDVIRNVIVQPELIIQTIIFKILKLDEEDVKNVFHEQSTNQNTVPGSEQVPISPISDPKIVHGTIKKLYEDIVQYADQKIKFDREHFIVDIEKYLEEQKKGKILLSIKSKTDDFIDKFYDQLLNRLKYYIREFNLPYFPKQFILNKNNTIIIFLFPQFNKTGEFMNKYQKFIISK